jgi:hypothetical protein
MTMSINLMSSIFRTEFRDLNDAEGNTTKASTAKFVCIALADHANDEGEGAYPSIDTMAYKTNLSRTAVINALDALKYNGILIANGESKRRTIDYTINKTCFSKDSQRGVLVNLLDSQSQPTLPSTVNPVDPNHTLTINKPSMGDKSPLQTNELPIEWQIGIGQENIVMPDNDKQERIDAANLIATGTGSKSKEVYELAFAFQDERKITFSSSDIKGQRKAAKILVEKKVKPDHIRQAVRKLQEINFTCVNLFSVQNVAIEIANPSGASKSFEQSDRAYGNLGI